MMKSAIRQKAGAEDDARQALAREIAGSEAKMRSTLPGATARRDETAAELDAALAALEPLEEAALEADRALRGLTEGHASLVARNEAELRATADPRVRETVMDFADADDALRAGRRYWCRWGPSQLHDRAAERARLADLRREVEALEVYVGDDLLSRLNAIRESAGLQPFRDSTQTDELTTA